MQIRLVEFEHEGARTSINVEYIVAVEEILFHEKIHSAIHTTNGVYRLRETYEETTLGLKAAVNL